MARRRQQGQRARRNQWPRLLGPNGRCGQQARAGGGSTNSRAARGAEDTHEDQYQRAEKNLQDEKVGLAARIRKIEARLAVPVGGRRGRAQGYATAAERHAKTIRLKTLKARLARVERRLDSGAVSVVRGGKELLRKRNNLGDARLLEAQWRRQWESARLFLTADGEKDAPWGNYTIQWNPDERWLEICVPAALAHLANQPRNRYRLSCAVGFSYRGDEVAAQAASGAVRYDIRHDKARDRWYLDASWKTSPTPAPPVGELRQHPVVSVDVNHGHLEVAVIAPDGNLLGTPITTALNLAGLPTATRDGRLRAALSAIITTAKKHGARAIVIEALNFAEARAEGRERTGNRPSRGERGKDFRRTISSIPTGRFRDRITQMAYNAELSIIVIDPAYTSRWAAEHWLGPLREHHPKATNHHAAALVIGRRGLGHRARRRVTGNRTAPEEAARPAQTRPGTKPVTKPAPRKPTAPRGTRQPPGTKTGPPHGTTAGNQAAQDRPGPPTEQRPLSLSDQERCES